MRQSGEFFRGLPSAEATVLMHGGPMHPGVRFLNSRSRDPRNRGLLCLPRRFPRRIQSADNPRALEIWESIGKYNPGYRKYRLSDHVCNVKYKYVKRVLETRPGRNRTVTEI
jgi:hypothetical protein